MPQRSRLIRRLVPGAAGALAAAAALALGSAAGAAGGSGATRSVHYDWAHDGLSGWTRWWGSATRAGGDALVLASPRPRVASETHSSLVTTRRTWSNFTVTTTLRPLHPLRVGDPPNAWETGWLMFRFTDLGDYYWFVVKPNGWELGKKQGSDQQIFLATGDRPQLGFGATARLRVGATGARIAVDVDGRRVVDFVDPHPLRSGAVGLYEEDAQVRWGPVGVTVR
jgi:hypothetical protein